MKINLFKELDHKSIESDIVTARLTLIIVFDSIPIFLELCSRVLRK
jgi:hypothetical protein